MPRPTIILLAIAFTAAALAPPASADSFARPSRRSVDPAGAGVEGAKYIRLHLGLSVPTGNFNDNFDAGIGLGASFALGVSRTVLFSVGAGYHGFNGNGFDGDATIVPVTFNVENVFPSSGEVHPWIGGGVGLYNIDVESNAVILPPGGSNSVSETNGGINLGVGFGAKSGERDVWGVGLRWHHVFEGDTFNDLDFLTLQGTYGFSI
jgi:hypothetical protein